MHLLMLVLALVKICLELFVSANADASTSNAVGPTSVVKLVVRYFCSRYLLVPGYHGTWVLFGTWVNQAPFAPPISPQVPIVHSVIPHQTCILSVVRDIHG